MLPISPQVAQETARSYVERYALPMDLHPEPDLSMEKETGVWAFRLKDMGEAALLVSREKGEVLGIRMGTPARLETPHAVRNPFSKAAAIQRVLDYIGDRKRVRVAGGHFYWSGTYEYPHPCWCISVDNLDSTMDGSLQTSYFLDLDSGRVEAQITL